MTLALRFAVRSDVGLLREGNEDSAYAGPHLLAVADGMGGHAAGEVASAATIQTISQLDAEYQQPDLVQALADAVANANMRLQEMIYSDPSTEGMGTTLTAMLWSGPHAAICHIGDSRAYLLRDRRLYQITHDHTLVQSLVDEGRITEDDVATHPQRSLLLRALDGRTIAEPDLSTLEALPGDRFLLCSDGLSGVVTEETLEHALGMFADPDQVAMQLVDLAIRGGGPDNITCIVADLIDTMASSVPPTVQPITAGAAATGSPQELREIARQNSPAGRAQLTTTKPQPTAPDDPGSWQANGTNLSASGGQGGQGGQGGGPRGGGHRRRGHDDDDDDFDTDDGDGETRRRRRLPIVRSLLVVFVLVLIGGGIATWQYIQGQYYVGEDAGQVTIFRGVNESLAGISLSSVYSHSGIPVSQISDSDMSEVTATISSGNLGQAQQTVASIRKSVQSCQAQWQALQTWQSKETAYTTVVDYNKAHPKAKKALPANPGVQPATPGAECAAATAFGIAPANLPSAQSSPTASPGASASASPHPSTSPSKTK
jgi:PPM family protein phosphatase